MKTLYFVILSLVIFAASCADPAANKPKAQTSEPTANNTASNTANTTPPATAAGTELAITPGNSKVEFTGSKVTGKHDGGFKQFKGAITLVGDKPEASSVTVSIDTPSVYTDADGLTKHLQTADFFESGKFPTATFTSTKIAPDLAKGAGNFIVTGDLDLHGVKKTVTFPAEINVTPDAVTVNAEFTINRKDFGILYAGKADDLIRDDVVIKLTLKAPRKK
jgi:polyisoprenoid-binding protein YceI